VVVEEKKRHQDEWIVQHSALASKIDPDIFKDDQRLLDRLVAYVEASIGW
jgi:hypothetical protein